jgi:hypothetical protein
MLSRRIVLTCLARVEKSETMLALVDDVGVASVYFSLNDLPTMSSR